VKCDHCWFECGPEKTAKMTAPQGKNYLTQIKNAGARWVSFTGGEPFLEYDLLHQLIRFASVLNLKSETVTNCFWGETVAKSKEHLEPLVDAGLDVLNISVDDFHQEHISLDNIKNCYQAAVDLGVKIVILVVTHYHSVLNKDKIKEVLKDDHIQVLGSKKVGDAHALLIETPFYPIGRGASIDQDLLILGQSNIVGSCKEVLCDVGIDPSGIVYPCCGPLSCLSSMSIGNLNESSLDEILEAAWQINFFKQLRSGGPPELVSNLNRQYTDRCHACYVAAARLCV
jgi:MoaA/NifB/PqqE/SkfB family radical SAM enzyme